MKKKPDYLLKTLMMQFLICALLLGALAFLSQKGSAVLKDLRKTVSDELGKNTVVPALREAFAVIEPTTAVPTETAAPATETATVSTTEATTTPVTAPDTTVTAALKATVEKEETTAEDASAAVYSFNQPMIRPVAGEITSPFGSRTHPVTGSPDFHYGTDIAAAEGTPVRAAFTGTVVKAEYHDMNGNMVKIDHGNGNVTVYCHLLSFSVKPGDKVKAGQTVGLVGSTGDSTGPHLHFAIALDGIYYDPQIALETAVDEV
ncbi:MAG: M23 family metallopeptidase [Clostridia bacterium]|nr:M23 family metallopeptidase [Clostridia bacterium]